MNADSLRASATVNYGGNPGWPSPFGEMAPTLEECEVLYALVRATRPKLVYESGTGMGISAAFIASALQDNGTGRLLTYESDPEYERQARENLTMTNGVLTGLPVEFVDEMKVGSEELKIGVAELIYLDSAPGQREREISWWLSRKSSPLVVVHDANRLYPEFDLGAGVILPTAYGMWIGRPA